MPKTTERRIDGARLTRVREGALLKPAITFDGEAPAPGETLVFALDNGVTYAGTVADAVEDGGEVLVEFKDGIAPVQK